MSVGACRRMGPEMLATEGARRCSVCGKAKAASAFYLIPGRGRLASSCRACHRRKAAARRRTEAYRAWVADYLARPEVRARRTESLLRRADRRKATARLYRATPRAKVLHCRRQARYDLAKATTEAGRAKLRARIAAYDRELARMDADAADPL